MIKSGTLFANRYSIIEKVGAGGMADVYRAEDTKTGRIVALKVLKADLSHDADFVRRFKTEGEAAASLNNANIVSVYGVGSVGKIYYIAMEFVDGITLKEYIRRKGALSPRECMAISAQVAVGLRAAHARHIVHRDIKPQNIILSREGKVKVTDFGIAHSAGSETKTVDGSAMGSVHYISPEQAKGMPCDERSDIYSLGIVMYEMITGRVPFEKDTAVAVALAHMNETMAAPSSINPNCPKALEQIIFRCTQKAKDRRYHNCTELLTDLKVAVASPDFNFEKKEQDNLMKSNTLVFSPEEVENMRRMSSQNQGQSQNQNASVQAPATAIVTADSVEENAVSEVSDVQENVRYIRNNEYEDDVFDGEAEEKDGAQKPPFMDDEEEDEKSIFDRVIVIIGIALGALIICLLIYLIASLSGCVQTGSKKPAQSQGTTATTEATTAEEDNIVLETIAKEDYDPNTQAIVPNVVGMSIKAAMKLLQDSGLEYKISTRVVYSDVYKIGIICEQSYPDGTIVLKGSTIVITLSAGSDKFEIKPSYIGGLLSVFKNDVADYLDVITVEYEGIFSETIGVNRIISIDPPSGLVHSGDTIHVVYSRGPEVVTVPDLHGYTAAEASLRLNDFGLVLGSVSQAYSETVELDKVIEQQYPVGTQLPNGSSVSIVVSLGPDPSVNTIPDLFGWDVEDAIEALNGLNLDIVVTLIDGEDEEMEPDLVIAQDPPAGTSAERGMTVTLTINRYEGESSDEEDEGFELKNYVGSGKDETLDELDSLKLNYSVSYIQTMDPNQNMIVASQNPAAGSTVHEGDTITLEIYEYDDTPDDEVTVQNYVGKDYDNAAALAVSDGLIVGVPVYQPTSDASLDNKVMSQSLASGSMVARNSEIVFTVYQYDAPNIVVGNYVGMDIEAAKTKAISDGLTIGQITETVTDIASNDNKVAFQSLGATSEVDEGAVIDFTVYRYEAPETESTKVTVVSYIGDYIDNAQNWANSVGLILDITYYSTTDPNQNNIIRSQNPSGGQVDVGQHISVEVGKYEAPTEPPTEPPTQPTEPPTEPPTQPTEPPTEPPTQPTEPPTEPPTQPTDPPTEPPTQPTEPPTEPPTQPTEPPTEPTNPPTDPPTDPVPESSDEGGEPSVEG